MRNDFVVTREDLRDNKTRRVRWPTVDVDTNEPQDTSSQHDSSTEIQVALDERAKKKKRKENKKKVLFDDLDEFLTKNDLDTTQPPLSDVPANEQFNLYEYLKQEFGFIGGELASIVNQYERQGQTIAELGQEIEHMKEMMNDNMSSFSKPGPSSTMVVRASDAVENDQQQQLAPGIYCSAADIFRLDNTPPEDDSGWCRQLLICYYGDEAKLMRMRPQKKSGNKKFDDDFLIFARVKFRAWLEKHEQFLEDGTRKKLYTDVEIEKMLRNLPQYLARKADDLKGPRGVNKQIQEIIKSGGDPASYIEERKRILENHQIENGLPATQRKRKKQKGIRTMYKSKLMLTTDESPENPSIPPVSVTSDTLVTITEAEIITIPIETATALTTETDCQNFSTDLNIVIENLPS